MDTDDGVLVDARDQHEAVIVRCQVLVDPRCSLEKVFPGSHLGGRPVVQIEEVHGSEPVGRGQHFVEAGKSAEDVIDEILLIVFQIECGYLTNERMISGQRLHRRKRAVVRCAQHHQAADAATAGPFVEYLQGSTGYEPAHAVCHQIERCNRAAFGRLTDYPLCKFPAEITDTPPPVEGVEGSVETSQPGPEFQPQVDPKDGVGPL